MVIYLEEQPRELLADQSFILWRKVAKRRHSFLKRKYSVSNSPFLEVKFAKLQQKNGLLRGRVSPDSCLSYTHLCVLWKRVSGEVEICQGYSGLWLHQGTEKKTLLLIIRGHF
jgi:hypothetical protein